MPKFSYRDRFTDFHWFTLTSHGILFFGIICPTPKPAPPQKCTESKQSQWRVGFAVWPGWGFAVARLAGWVFAAIYGGPARLGFAAALVFAVARLGFAALVFAVAQAEFRQTKVKNKEWPI